MDYTAEINSLASETLALSAVVAGIAGRLAALSPETRKAVGLGLDDAANLVEQVAMIFGPKASPQHTVAALSVVEQIRDMTFPGEQGPRHGV